MGFYTTCLWPLPVHTRMLPGIIIPPLLHDPGGNSICVIHQLEASYVGSTFPEFGQVNIHESLQQERNSENSSEEHGVEKRKPVYAYGSQLRKISSLCQVRSSLREAPLHQPHCELTFLTGSEPDICCTFHPGTQIIILITAHLQESLEDNGKLYPKYCLGENNRILQIRWKELVMKL